MVQAPAIKSRGPHSAPAPLRRSTTWGALSATASAYHSRMTTATIETTGSTRPRGESRFVNPVVLVMTNANLLLLPLWEKVGMRGGSNRPSMGRLLHLVDNCAPDRKLPKLGHRGR